MDEENILTGIKGSLFHFIVETVESLAGIDRIENNKVNLPDNALNKFGIKNGDEVIILGDSSQGLVLTPKFNFTDPSTIGLTNN